MSHDTADKGSRKAPAQHSSRRLSRGARWLPAYFWQRLTRPAPRGPVHLIIALADHFEPGFVPEDGQARAPYDEQERRMEMWCREYPLLVDKWRDADGRTVTHSYFYPAEQYEKGIIERLAEHCHAGWGEIEIHLHHGIHQPDTSENTRRQLVEFRDTLAQDHGCLSYLDGSGLPQYAFVHGNFALANSSDGRNCGVDDEMQILADTGCYADMTLPTGSFHPAQTAKINSLYECALPLDQRAPHRQGRDLTVGQAPRVMPLMIQGPLMLDFSPPTGSRRMRIENGALTRPNPPSLHRLSLWKEAAITVQGRPDWLFVKLHCHGMDPAQKEVMLGDPFRKFLRELVEGAGDRQETLHFVSAREMVNIMLAGCDGREGSPRDYRDFRLQKLSAAMSAPPREISQSMVKG